MQTFQAGNRTWSVGLDAAAVRRVWAQTGVDLLDLAKTPHTLASDVMLLVAVLWAIVQPQADAAGVSDERFGELLAREAIEDATKALLDSVLNFFPPRRSEILQAAIAKYQEVQGVNHGS